MSSNQIVAFILSVKKYKFNIKFLLREIMLYAFAYYPLRYNNPALLEYAVDQGFLTGDPTALLKKAANYGCLSAVIYWQAKGGDLTYGNRSFCTTAAIKGGDLLRYAISKFPATIAVKAHAAKAYDHIEIFIEEKVASLGYLIYNAMYDAIHTERDDIFDKLFNLYDKNVLLDFAIELRCNKFRDRLFNAGVDIKLSLISCFWTRILDGDFESTDPILNRGFIAKKQEIALMARNPSHIYEVVSYCYKKNLPLKIKGKSWKKGERILARLSSEKNIKLLKYFINAIGYDVRNLPEEYRMYF